MPALNTRLAAGAEFGVSTSGGTGGGTGSVTAGGNWSGTGTGTGSDSDADNAAIGGCTFENGKDCRTSGDCFSVCGVNVKSLVGVHAELNSRVPYFQVPSARKVNSTGAELL